MQKYDTEVPADKLGGKPPLIPKGQRQKFVNDVRKEDGTANLSRKELMTKYKKHGGERALDNWIKWAKTLTPISE